jgi:Zn finger protein HypA/HybF involved in hydrogenase expression
MPASRILEGECAHPLFTEVRGREFCEVGRPPRASPCGGLPFFRIMGAHVEERATYCPRCGRPATRIVRGTPDPEYLQDLERVSIDYQLGGLMAFEEASEWWCRSCGHEWREDESSLA